MFCSFSEQPLILRLYGKGRVIQQINEEWKDLFPLFPDIPGKRQIILLDIESAQTSCGHGVPIYELKQERQTLIKWAKKKGEEGIRDYWEAKNQKSIDGLPSKILEE